MLRSAAATQAAAAAERERSMSNTTGSGKATVPGGRVPGTYLAFGENPYKNEMPSLI